jgi:negative regulator of sigma E activity
LAGAFFFFWIAKSIPETFAESQASVTVASIIPLPGEAQPFVTVTRADKEQKAREVERTWQIRIEADLKAALIRRCKVHTQLELPVFGPLTREATRDS